MSQAGLLILAIPVDDEDQRVDPQLECDFFLPCLQKTKMDIFRLETDSVSSEVQLYASYLMFQSSLRLYCITYSLVLYIIKTTGCLTFPQDQ